MIESVDLVIFFIALGVVLITGLWAARLDSPASSGGKADDYFLAGRSVPWWSIAGSIFGTNVSAAHMVGMLGVGYSIGFAQAHYELGAILALFALCYLFLPVYRRMGLVTLSQFLERRYGPGAGALYSVVMLVLILVQLTAAFYIGSRAFVHLLEASGIPFDYAAGVVILAGVSAIYTISGGLKAVIYTDVLQAALLIIGGLILAFFTFAHESVDGWAAMLARDAASDDPRMVLMLPSNHPDLPWTGALTGLLLLHFFYWGANQYVVQRALAARSDRDARLGVLAGGFLKLLIPFMSIATGVAAAQLFDAEGLSDTAPDDAFPRLVATVVPAGLGLAGLIMAGLLAAILSTIDSMLNSASTLATVDLYKKYYRPDADDAALVRYGRWVVAALMAISGLLALYSYDPQNRGNFFLTISNLSSHFTPGILVAFFAGLLVAERTDATDGSGARRAVSAVPVILAAPLLSFGLEFGYNAAAPFLPAWLTDALGMRLNFLHRVLVVVLLSALLLGGMLYRHRVRLNVDLPSQLSRDFLLRSYALYSAVFTLAVYGVCSILAVSGADRLTTGVVAAILCFAPFALRAALRPRGGERIDDRLIAGLLFALATFVFFRFF